MIEGRRRMRNMVFSNKDGGKPNRADGADSSIRKNCGNRAASEN
ncbi:MAG: hypothetical protein JWM30_2977 [Burkholderia sp.]|nr:hypothetical protein [Burkholderia sp.]